MFARVIAFVMLAFLSAHAVQAQGVATITRTNNNAGTFTAGNIDGTITVSEMTNTASNQGLRTGAVAGANFPGSWYTPAVTSANMQILEINNATAGQTASYRLTITFDRAVTNPVLHITNVDNGTWNLSSTRQTNGSAVSLTKVSGNSALELSGTLINSTPQAAVNGGCAANDGSNPSGGCGSIRLNGQYKTVSVLVTDTNTTTVSGDGHSFGISVPDQYDFGDAPASYGTARHAIADAASNPSIGSLIDYEISNQPNSDATGDDSGGQDDEDGVTIPTLILGQAATINVVVGSSGTRYLQGWIDWNGNGTFTNTGTERIATNILDNGAGDTNPAVGIIGIAVTPPDTAILVPTMARFRFSSTSNLSATANAIDGEAEDYQILALYVDLAVQKSSAVVSDPINNTTNPKAIPGAVMRYCILVTNNSTTDVSNIVMTDNLPAQVTFVPGSMRSGATCAGATTIEDDNNSGTDETNPYGMSYSSNVVTGRVITIASNATAALTFNVTID